MQATGSQVSYNSLSEIFVGTSWSSRQRVVYVKHVPDEQEQEDEPYGVARHTILKGPRNRMVHGTRRTSTARKPATPESPRWQRRPSKYAARREAALGHIVILKKKLLVIWSKHQKNKKQQSLKRKYVHVGISPSKSPHEQNIHFIFKKFQRKVVAVLIFLKFELIITWK